MTPLNKLISLIVAGSIIFLMASWWENSISNDDDKFIKLGGLLFHTSLEPGMKEAMNESKPIFLYFRSDTCYWCIIFEKEALSDGRVIDILNNSFVLISIDPFKQKTVSSNLNVRTTPFMIFFTKDGEEISRVPGYLPVDDFLNKLNLLTSKQNQTSGFRR